MPYVDQEARARLDSGGDPDGPGELNYVITKLVDSYLCRKGQVRYAHLNEAIGVVECVKQELYRRVTAPYEDQKIAETGDVYDLLQRMK